MLIKKKKLPNGYWTEEKIFEELKNYETLDEFRKNKQGAYDAARRLGLLDKLRENINFHFQPNGYWNKEKCYKEAQKYKTKIEFKNQSPSAYAASVKNKWIDEFTWIVSTRNPNYGKSYTIDELNLIAEQCYNRTELKTKFYHAYNFAKKNNLLDKIIYKSYYTKENQNKINKWVTKPNKYTYDSLFKIAQNYKTLNEFALNEQSAYVTAICRGWIKDYKWLQRKKHFYTNEECWEIAKQCETITEFIEKDKGAYQFAIKNDLIKTYHWFKKVNSILEKKVEKFLLENNIKYEKQKKFDWLKFKSFLFLDFYLPEYNVAIECQGDQHYKEGFFSKGQKGLDIIRKRDLIKKIQCQKNKINLLYFARTKFDNSCITNLKELLEKINECKKKTNN